MKKSVKFLIISLFISQIAFTQSKNDLLEQIDIYQKNVVLNKPYDADKAKLFEAMNSVAALEYQKIIRESESRGFCEYYSESDIYKETLTIEIANDKQPYRLSFSIRKEYRSKNPDGTYSQWDTSYDISKKYLYKLQYGIYVALFGPIKLPNEIQNKIDLFNQAQTKERKKIILGKDY